MSDGDFSNWIEYKPKQFLSRETAIELLGAQEKELIGMREELLRLHAMFEAMAKT